MVDARRQFDGYRTHHPRMEEQGRMGTGQQAHLEAMGKERPLAMVEEERVLVVEEKVRPLAMEEEILLAFRQSMAAQLFRKSRVRLRLGRSQLPLTTLPSLGRTVPTMLGPGPALPTKSRMVVRFRLHIHHPLALSPPLTLPHRPTILSCVFTPSPTHLIARMSATFLQFRLSL